MADVSGLVCVQASADLRLDVYFHMVNGRAVIDSVELEDSVTDIKSLLSREVITQIHNVIWGIK